MYPGGPYWEAADVISRIVSWNIHGEETGIMGVYVHIAGWFR